MHNRLHVFIHGRADGQGLSVAETSHLVRTLLTATGQVTKTEFASVTTLPALTLRKGSCLMLGKEIKAWGSEETSRDILGLIVLG